MDENGRNGGQEKSDIMKVMREMRARFVKDYVLFIEGASFFLCNGYDWQSSGFLREMQ